MLSERPFLAKTLCFSLFIPFEVVKWSWFYLAMEDRVPRDAESVLCSHLGAFFSLCRAFVWAAMENQAN